MNRDKKPLITGPLSRSPFSFLKWKSLTFSNLTPTKKRWDFLLNEIIECLNEVRRSQFFKICCFLKFHFHNDVQVKSRRSLKDVQERLTRFCPTKKTSYKCPILKLIMASKFEMLLFQIRFWEVNKYVNSNKSSMFCHEMVDILA